MAVKNRIPYPDGIYFITYTCFNWIPIIDITDGYDIIYKGFNYLKEQGHFISGYVIMPNHLHALIAFQNIGKNLNKLIGETKRFSAYELVRRLKERSEEKLLFELSQAVTASDKRRGKLHEVWEDSFDWKLCDTIQMIERVLDYMHDNPCSGKWNLVESPVDYLHSSAKFYITGEQGIYPLTNYMELEDIDLTKMK